jgi:porin-like protein
MGEIMNFGRNVALPAAVACMLCSPLALLSYAAQADELSDLQEKNQALQQRIDQLAQAIPGAGGFYTQGAPPAPSAGAGLVGGSFPRSFLIPGTDTSLRIGGEIRENLTYWFNGRSPNVDPPSSNVLNNGGLNSAPVHIHNAIVGGVVVPSSNPTRSRDVAIFNQTPQQTKFNIETRTPTAYGEARTFVELDFAGGSSFSPGGVNQLTSTNSLTPRLRYAYGTLGGFLAGQANSNFSDPDADPPQLEFGGQVGNPGVTRVPQIRYTVPLQPYGFLGALSFSAEAPEIDAWTAGQGIIGSDTGDVSLAANPALTCTSTFTAATGTVTTNCPVGGTQPAVNPTKNSAPDLTAAWYIPQPWGHLDMSLVYRPSNQLKDGRFVDKTVSGYGGHIGGDVKPGWFGWAKDDITFHMSGGDGIGRYIGGNTSFFGFVSNYPALAPTTAAVGSAVQLKTVFSFGANASYTHWWTDNIRSYVGGGIHHQDVPNNLRSIPVSATGVVGPANGNNPVCPGGINAARLAATGGCNLNTELVSASVGTIWSPVAFVDVGLEFAYGHRQTLSGLKGDTQALVNRYTFRF